MKFMTITAEEFDQFTKTHFHIIPNQVCITSLAQK